MIHFCKLIYFYNLDLKTVVPLNEFWVGPNISYKIKELKSKMQKKYTIIDSINEY